MEPEEIDEAFRERVAILEELRLINAGIERLVTIAGRIDERLGALEKDPDGMKTG